MTSPVALVSKPTVAGSIKSVVVDLLKEALVKAEAGEIESVIIILKRPDGTWHDDRSGCIGMVDAIGHLEIIKQAWINVYLKED